MSLWFQPPSPFKTTPSDSRRIGFSQIPNGISPFAQEEVDAPQRTSASGGVSPTFSSRISLSNNINNSWNFDGPYFNDNSIGFNTEINNNIVQNYEINYIVSEVAGDGGGGGGGGAFACTDLASCGGTGTASVLTVLTAVSLGVNGLTFNRRTLNFNEYGLYTGMTDPGNTNISTVSCT